jgi:hypothetical protein
MCDRDEKTLPARQQDASGRLNVTVPSELERPDGSSTNFS